jgi:uncharacterized protein YndB with AHSA1/START domain
MPQIVSEITIDAPAAAVFDFATTPANWPRFWPVTLGVSGDIDAPARAGAHWVEQVKISFWRGEFHWEAAECTRATHFVMVGRSYGHGWAKVMPSEDGRIEYTLTETAGRTHFRRVMTYTDSNLLLKIMDALVMHRTMTRAIQQALGNLKSILESGVVAAGTRS